MKRRHFVQVAATGAAQFMFGGLASKSLWAGEKSAFAGPRGRKVAILGGGVAGMSAAHELMERGFEVSVFEMKDIPGGKARSIAVPGSGQAGRGDLPGEHGFRFFPGFYRHLPDTMKRIPYRGQTDGVFGNLTTADRIEVARADQPPILMPSRPPHAIGDIKTALSTIFESQMGISTREAEFFFSKIDYFLTCCDERRLAELESISWWDYIDAGNHSPAYQKYLAIGLTRTLVAAKAEVMSARTGFTILTQLLFNIIGRGQSADRVLNGPTSEVWIGPWLDHLRSNGVDYHLGARVRALEVGDGLISGAWIGEDGRDFRVEADYFVSCVPVEVMQRWLTPELLKIDPSLAGLGKLRTEWMSGLQLFLNRDIAVSHGHCILIDSPWAVTLISQPQFWRDCDVSQRGDGSVRGILSIDVSDWNAPGILYGKPAKQCSKQELFEEVWAQLTQHLRNQKGIDLSKADLVTWFLDPGITFPAPGRVESAEPLLVNTVGSWGDRPEATRPIPNLLLASDFVRTYTDLATMEGANEAARRAVNGILAASGASEKPCDVWKLDEPEIYAPAKALDRIRFKLGQSHLAV